MMSHVIAFAFAATLLLAVVASSATASNNCELMVTPCDDTWSSRINQTFAYQAAGPHDVQLKSYWGKYDACIGQDATSFFYTTCATPASLWAYGPNTIKSWVYFNNTQGKCLSRTEAPNNSIYPNAYGVYLADCCLNQKSQGIANCTIDEVNRQMWIEPPTSHNPYSRFINKATAVGVKGEMCMTRVSTSC